MVRALHIPPDPDAPVTEVQLDALEDYQAIVGGWIEAVDIHSLGVTVYVNEEGLLRQLPFNSRAMSLWWYFVPEARQTAVLVGPALVVGLPDRNGNSTDIPANVAEMMTRAGIWSVQAHVPGIEEWYVSQQTYDDYFEALVYAMTLLNRWEEVDDVRVVPVTAAELAGGGTPIEPAA